MKDSAPFSHPGYNEAQIAAAQAIRDAGEDAQLHMAMLKKKYMDIVRHNFYNAFAPHQFVKERLQPNHHEGTVVKVHPQPLRIYHSQNNPCSGNIMNCLHLVPSRLGKIVPPNEQPCYGPNCNHVLFNSNSKPMANPKPSYTSHSVMKNPTKRPQKHRICDRKRPDHNCHHRSTIWPTYSTIKFNTKFRPFSTTPLPKPTDVFTAPFVQTSVSDTVTKKFNPHLIPTDYSTKSDKTFGFGLLKADTSKLENEILGIPDVVIQPVTDSTSTPSSYKANSELPPESLISALAQDSSPSTSETAVKMEPELKEDTEIIPFLKDILTPISAIRENDILETSSFEAVKSTQFSTILEDEQNITVHDLPTTTSNNDQSLKFVDEENPIATDAVTTEISKLPNKGRVETTIGTLGENEEITTEGNILPNRMAEVTFLTENIVQNPTTVQDNPAWKIEIEVTSTPAAQLISSSTTIESRTTQPDQPTIRLDEYTWENKTPLNYFDTTLKAISEDSFMKTTPSTDYEQITRMNDVDLSETTPLEVQQREDTTLKNSQKQETTFQIFQDPTEYTTEYLSREDLANNVGTKTVEEITTPFTVGSDVSEYRTLFEETSTMQSSTQAFQKFFTTLQDKQEARDETLTETFHTFEMTPNGRQQVIGFTTEISDVSMNQDNGTDMNQEYREDTISENHVLDSHSTVDYQQEFTTEGKDSRIILEEESDLPQSTRKLEEWTTLLSETTEYLSKANEDTFLLTDHSMGTIEETESKSAPVTEFSFDVPSTQIIKSEIIEGKTDSVSGDPTYQMRDISTEGEQMSTMITRDGKLTVNDLPVFTTREAFERENDITTEDSLTEYPQFREGEEDQLYETTQSMETTSEQPMIREGTELEEGMATEAVTSNSFGRNIDDITTEDTVTGFPQLREGEGELYETTISLVTTPEETIIRKGTAFEEENTTETVTSSSLGRNIDYITTTDDSLTEFPNLRDSVDEELYETTQPLLDTSEQPMMREVEESTSVAVTRNEVEWNDDTTTTGDSQLREGEDGQLFETTQSLETTSEEIMYKEVTEFEDQNIIVTSSTFERSDERITTDSSNVFPQSRLEETEAQHETTPSAASDISTGPEEEKNTIAISENTLLSTEETTISKLNGSEEKRTESIQTIPREILQRTDTPGLLFKDWGEEHTEETSQPDSALEQKFETTEYAQLKSDDETPALITSITEISNSDVYEKSTQVEHLTTDHHMHPIEVRVSGDVEVTKNTPIENPSHPSYQNGILKFTSEFQTSTEHLQAEVNDDSTNPGLAYELDSLNRKARSVQHNNVELKSYPTTECVLCMLGLPHGHRAKRSQTTINNSTTFKKENDKTTTPHSEKSNCSISINLNIEENSKFYASTILELLPVIKEGYRNNAFSEEDKKVIKSLFGDMRGLVDEETFEKITESSAEILMGDGASRTDEIIEELDYDSSELILDEDSDKERLKRSKKSYQIMNDILKKMPNNLKDRFNVPTHRRSSRSAQSTHLTQSDASAILALLAEKGELEIQEDEDEEYEYYEDEEDEYADDLYVDPYEDEYDDSPSFKDLIKLARRHRERKARADKS